MIRIMIVLLSLSLFSCDFKNDKTPAEEVVLKEETLPQETKAAQDKKSVYSTQTFDNWKSYYNDEVETFDLSNFKKEESYQLLKQETSTAPVWDKNFKPVHKKLLVYNADSSLYIDFNTYQIQFDEENNLVVSPDQEVILGNTETKEANRLLFYGPSFWVEDAYFKNDSILILLENSTDKKPAYQEINLRTLKATYYLYDKPLEKESNYRQKRIKDLFKDNM